MTAVVLPFHRAARRRPMPPDFDLHDPLFVLADNTLGAWARSTFVDDDGPLANPRHAPLQQADIAWLWASVEGVSAGRAVMGECRIPAIPRRDWSSQLGSDLLRRMLGRTPDFIITISAPHAAAMDDATFCALVEHELCHAGQAIDEFGTPRFTSEGLPIWSIIPHDVEQFVDVVARYGAGPAQVDRMVEAANAGPQIARAAIDIACGTCASTPARRRA